LRWRGLNGQTLVTLPVGIKNGVTMIWRDWGGNKMILLILMLLIGLYICFGLLFASIFLELKELKQLFMQKKQKKIKNIVKKA